MSFSQNYGFGLGFVKLSAAVAAFTANILETRAHVINSLPCAASYLDSVGNLRTPTYNSVTQDVRDELIDPFRVLMKNIEDAAEEMGINVNGDRELGEIDGPDSKSNRIYNMSSQK